ncbi:LuxR family maltose regulon positive regulatory protein [Microbacterium sp. AG1240]|uniref:helix-turn-helix transcriptional regulator n=1 Tax=Microbacterium sp. AG1240 TaxID=2183992 RepID=UPI000EB2C5F7|nr:LuxR family transcriptional regulator [Microbacterium sp. AG1240]RKT36101.1 LuxR family maltose regulon positive regulatory protein [Microbacterium sp. AG1240]
MTQHEGMTLPPRPVSASVSRPRLLDVLSSESSVVVVIGPRGAGKTVLLSEWFSTRTDAAWLGVGPLPDALPTARTLVIDAVDDLPADDWGRLDRWLVETPGARLRVGARAPFLAMSEWDATIVHDLAFTRAELADYLGQRGSTADPRTVLMATGGLPDAVRLVTQIGATARRDIDALLARVWADAALATEEARLAIPVTLTPDLVAELGGPADFFERAVRRGDGAWVGGPSGLAFALTAPVRAATLARHAVDATDHRDVRERAAEALLAQGSLAPAIVEAVDVGRLDLVDTALKNGGLALLSAHGPTLVALLQGIPTARLRQHPVIALSLGVMYNARRQHRLRALEMFAIALVGMQTAPRSSSDRALLRALESIARRLTGVGDGGVRAARSASAQLSELPTAESEQLEALRGDLRVHLGVSLLYGGHPDEARTEFERAVTGAVRPSVELMAIGGVALTHALAGDVPDARRWIATAEERTWAEGILDEYPGSMLRIAQARVALEDGDPATSVAFLDRVWPIIDTIEHWPLLGAVRALADHASGRPEEGLARLRSLRSHRGARMRSSRPAARMLDATEAALALAAGDLVSARRLTVHRSDGAAVRLAVARVALHDGEHERALRLIADTRPATPDQRMAYLATSAVVLRRLDRRDESDALVRQVGAMQRALGLHTPLLLVAAGERELFVHPYAAAAAASVPTAPPRLTPREAVVLAELARTAHVDEVAARLHVSPNTVKSQRRTLYRKLGVTRREDALAVAVAHRLLDGTDDRTREITAADANTSTEASANRTT